MTKIHEKMNDMRDSILKDLMDRIEKQDISDIEKLSILKAIETRFVNPDSALQLSFSAPDPTETRIRAPHFINLKPDCFKLAMYPIKSPKKLLQFLQNMDQVKDPNSPEAKTLKSVFVVLREDKTPLKPEEEAVYNSVQELRMKVNEVHYEGIDALLILYAYLYNFAKVVTNIKLLQFMKQIEMICVRLNSYDASLCLGIEAAQLHSLRNITGVFSLINDFIFEYNSTQAMKQLMQQRQQPTGQQKPASETPATFAVKVKDNKAVFALDTTRFGDIVLNDFSSPQGVVDKIQAIITGVIENGLALIKQAREIGNQINYNCYTNSFGSHALVSPGVEYLDMVRPIIEKYVKDDPADIESIHPKIIIVEEIKKVNFLVKFSKSKPLPGGQTLLPGESLEITQSSSDSRTTVREASRSQLDSQSDTIRQEVASSVEKETDSSWSTSKDTDEFKDSAFGASIDLTGIPMVSGGVSYDSSNGTSSSANDTRGGAENVLESATKSNISDKASKRDVTISESTKEQVEITTKNGIQRKIYNANLARSLQFIFQQMNEHYISVTYSVGYKIVITNQMEGEIFTLPQLEQMIQKYIRDGSEEIAILKRELDKIVTVNDWQEREVKMFPQGYTNKIPRYLAILKRQGIELNDLDYTLPVEVFEQSGVILEVTPYGIPTNVMVLTTILGEEALDDYKRNELQAQNTIQQAQADQLVKENEWIGLMIEFVKSIQDPREKLNALFKLKNPDSKLLNKTLFLKALDDPNIVKFFKGEGHQI
jgi:hypothetical protein